ncbi:MAG: hypothetical protein R3B70_19810 [Polyangiaceae bacterium]
MRFRSLAGLAFLFLGGCFSPSCDNTVYADCGHDFDCDSSEICDIWHCREARLCSAGCQPGEVCVQRDPAPAANPFESDHAGKQVCECMEGFLCGEGAGGFGPGGFAGEGGSTGTTGTTGTTGNGGFGGGQPPCSIDNPEEGSISALGGVGSETGPLFAKDRKAFAIGFEGTLDSLTPPLTSSGDSDVMVAGSKDGSTIDWVRAIGNDSRNVPTAIAAWSDAVLVATPFKGTLDTGDGTLDSGDGSAAAVVLLSTVDGSIHWSHAVHTDGAVELTAVARGGGGVASSVLIAGSYSGTLDLGSTKLLNAGELDAFVASIDVTTHETLWFHTFGGAGEETITALGTQGFGDIYLAGTFDVNLIVDTAPTAVADGQDAFLVHIFPSGILSWKNIIQGPGSQTVTAIATPWSSGTVITGTRGGPGVAPAEMYFDGGLTLQGSGLVDGFVARVSQDGLITSGALLAGAPGTGVVIPTAIDADCGAAGYLVGGTAEDGAQFGEYTLSSSGKRDAFIHKVSDTWEPVWTLALGTPEDDSITALVRATSGTLHAGGVFSGSGGTLGLTSAGAEDAFFLEVKP